MSNLVIVALPEEDDYINKISSEKVPHMTLLFLGEDASKVKNISKILDFTKHAAEQTLTRFNMEVDRRGIIGQDEADVLFFKKSKWSGFEAINTFRSNLLKDNNIRTAYDSAVQHDEWLPHLTLGYPATPAKPDERDYPKTYSVCFDRIAVWFATYDGIEFPLKDYEWDEVMAMGNDATENVLEHYGKLGMKWGHRRASSISADGHNKRATRKAAKQDKKFEKKASDVKTKIQIHNSIHEKSMVSIERINSKPEYVKAVKNGTFLIQDHPITKKYMKEQRDQYTKDLNDAASSMTNASGTRKYKVQQNDYDFLGFTVSAVDVKHVDSSTFKVNFVKDPQGQIVGFELDGDELTQSATERVVEDFLEHYGKKGMRWGVRKAYDIKVSERIARTRRVSKGQGSLLDKARVHARTSNYHLIRDGGFKGAAAARATREQQHLTRVRRGQETTRDVLKKVGGVSMLNLIDLAKVKKAA